MIHSRVRKLVTDEARDESNIETGNRILEAQKTAAETQVMLEDDVQKLLMEIESGELLLGGCDMCLKFHIRPNTPRR